MKKLAAFVAFAFIPAVAFAGVITLLSSAANTGVGTSYSFGGTTPFRWYQATLNGASAVSATVKVEGSADNTNWVPLATITLPTSASSVTDATATVQTANYVRGNLTAISGVGASVTLQSSQ